jgi:Glycosyl hydrolases family 18
MRNEKFTNYWIGEEKIPLNQMPAYVDVVPLAFVQIGSNNTLDFKFLTQNYSPGQIQSWIKEVQSNNTKVVFSLGINSVDNLDPYAFVNNVLQNVKEWGVDGVDFDYEPADYSQNQSIVLQVARQLRSVLGNNALLTAPIWSPWLSYPDFLNQFAAPLDYLTTMDYSPYLGFESTIDYYNQYAAAIGTAGNPQYGKVAIGTICMSPNPGMNTPIEDVAKLCQWEPPNNKKQGVMLYTFSYDQEGRILPPGTYSSTINNNLT